MVKNSPIGTVFNDNQLSNLSFFLVSILSCVMHSLTTTKLGADF